jgi:PAS domain S-box-containing protein
MKMGVTDYVSKDRLDSLGPAVSRALEESRLRKEKQQAEEQLKLLGAALAAAANGIFITDRAGAILWANPALSAITGYSLEEVRGRNPRLFKSGQHEAGYYGNLWQTILSGQVWKGELTNRRKDGSLYQDEMTITPVQDSQGRITHFIAIHQDITERKQLQAQFLQAQKMEVFGKLAGGVAHDFNNLLTVICGFTDLVLADLPEGSRSRDLLSQARNAGERAAGLTRQLLAFSRKQILQPQVLDLNAEVVETKKLLGRLLGDDIELASHLKPDPLLVMAEPGQIQQVLMNLAVNARDAMPGGGTVTISTRSVELDEAFAQRHAGGRAGPHVLLEVSDSGCGMTPDVQAHIFEPFFTTKEPGQGTGLGLATVSGIVGQSGGQIEVESQPGCGTVFRIYLPRVRSVRKGTQARPSSPGLPRGGESVLLVEDDDSVRSLAAMILRTAGYQVLEARDGQEGLDVFEHRAGPLHLLLTDVVMPHLDGCRLANLLTSRAPSLRVLYMSGYLDDTLARHKIQEKLLHFLHKPFNTEALLQKVRAVLDEPATARL